MSFSTRYPSSWIIDNKSSMIRFSLFSCSLDTGTKNVVRKNLGEKPACRRSFNLIYGAHHTTGKFPKLFFSHFPHWGVLENQIFPFVWGDGEVSSFLTHSWSFFLSSPMLSGIQRYGAELRQGASLSNSRMKELDLWETVHTQHCYFLHTSGIFSSVFNIPILSSFILSILKNLVE